MSYAAIGDRKLSEMSKTVTVLLVEDEWLLKELVQDALIEAGYEVEAASNGSEAVALLQVDAHRFGVLVTDIRMPGPILGWDVARRARELSPHIPVVYMSGDGASAWSAHGVPGSIMCKKPVPIQDLINAVARSVASQSA